VILYLYLEGARYAYTWDEGQLGLTALGVMRGEVPHRDLFDSYTGLLGVMGGGLFASLGVDSLYLRLPLFFALVVAYPFLYLTLSTFKRRRESALITLLTFSVSAVPQLGPTPVPLFSPLVIISSCSLWHYLRGGTFLWLLVGGGVTGILTGVKITGVYSILANLLVLGLATNRLLAVSVGGVTIILLGTILPSLQWGDIALSTLPLCASALLVVTHLFRRTPSEREFLAPLASVIVGTSIPIAAVILWFASRGALSDLVEGVIVRPKTRILFTQIDSPPIAAWIPSILMVGALGSAFTVRPPLRYLISLSCIAALLLFPSSLLSHELYRTLPPLLSLIPVAVIVSKRDGADTAVDQFAIVAIVQGAYLWLNMIPYSDPAYGASLSGVIFLAAFVLVELGGIKALGGGVVGALALGVITTSWFRGVPFSYDGLAPAHPQRGSIYVDEEWSDALARVCDIIDTRSGRGEQIFAGPDLPELPFFCDRPPSMNLVHDFFAPERARDHLDELPSNRSISLIAINWGSNFSPKYDEGRLSEMRRAFPNSETIYYRGRVLWEIRWRDPT